MIMLVGDTFYNDGYWINHGPAIPVDTVIQECFVGVDNKIKHIGCCYTGIRSQKDKPEYTYERDYRDTFYWRHTGLSRENIS
jgi:hypothetical protein